VTGIGTITPVLFCELSYFTSSILAGLAHRRGPNARVTVNPEEEHPFTVWAK